MDAIRGKQVLVTGGSGSIGSQITKRALDLGAEIVRVLENDETGLFNLKQEVDDTERLRTLLGDVRDRDRLRLAVEDIDVIFHAAALKHVELNEYNPFEAVQTNVQGTQNLVRAALEEEVDSFVAISTDKASNPTSVMGATKLLSERLVIAANAYKGQRDTEFSCVRFGNVLGSNGSVIPLFYNQIKSGGPVTVTDPEMTRFFMPIEEAVDLVFSANDRMNGGEVFVLKMPTFDVGTLAETMINGYAPTVDIDPETIEIDIIGPRPGERMHEKLISEDELLTTVELSDMFIIYPEIDLENYQQHEQTTSLGSEYTSVSKEPMSSEELLDMIDRAGVLPVEAHR
ncbi:Polysaccharide biosynthesis protein [Halohasta litchfieldiae]|jgi:FlaA1/EpsC-like NDP-sugar epimerase|uniref:Polysaccharide biosynthesis protein n=1 Tax=Halohasta litchfieldiae TaxID=1073996 RepID=A0A1H6Y3X3_9EURY|nr:UDP-N-acetylglucosamine 4,6-dehydratase family protein [Halohasta litchfieldiae]SEJ36003.1 Polysaccharide biosynthesis protein [Halohasta litchfieldiae]